jgi:hypothetical protein
LNNQHEVAERQLAAQNLKLIDVKKQYEEVKKGGS